MDYPFVDEIVQQLLNDSFSIFCGAGASADLTKRQWEDLFSDKTKKFYQSKCSDDLYLLADLEKHYYDKDNFYKNIKKKLLVKKGDQSEHIDSIINLNLNQIWTTNFDSIIERSIKEKYQINPVVLATSNDLLYKNLNAEYVVYKLNGTVEKPSSMVLTKTEFLEYFKKERLFFELLKRQLVLDSFLFVGYSFKDNLVLNALQEIKDIFPQNAKIHYRFKVKNYTNRKRIRQEFDTYENQYFLDTYNIKTIELNNYNQIDDYLKEVYRRFCNHNVFICGSFRQIDSSLRNTIEEIVDKLIYKLYLNDFNVYSGNGRGLGEIVLARAKLHSTSSHNRFINRPIIFSGDNATQKQKKNKLIIKDCNIMVIICGQDDALDASKNVINQFKQFSEKKDCLIIPVPATGYAARKIYESEEFKSVIGKTEYLKDLKFLNDPESIAELISNIILMHRREA